MTELQTSSGATRFSPLDDDMIAFRFGKNLEIEVDLYSAKWFDYRQLTPLQATRLYVEHFGTIYRSKFRSEIDRNAAPFIRTLELDTLLEGLESADDKIAAKSKRKFSACWIGRQTADAIGMPYDLYISYAIDSRLRFWNQRYLPQPQHLYSERDVEVVQSRWMETQETILYTCDDPAYLLDNYRGLPHQNDYHEWLIKQAYLRHNPHEYFARFIREQLLPAEKVRARVQGYVWEKIESLLGFV